MMVLTMDIIGDRSADGNEAGAGSDRKKPSPRKKYVKNVGEGDSAFAAQNAAGVVETENAIKAAAVDQFTAGVEAGIPIAAAKAVGKQRIRRGSSENFRHLIIPCRSMNVWMRSLRVTSP